MAETIDIDLLDKRTAFIDGDVRPIDDARGPGIPAEEASAEDAFAQQAVDFYDAEEKYKIELAEYNRRVEDEQDKHPLGITWKQAEENLGLSEPKPPYPEIEESEEEIDQTRLNKAATQAIHSAELTAKIEALKAQILDPQELERAITEAIAKDKARREVRERDS